MVGSKDTKRKRREPPPIPAQAKSQTSSANIESSPEVPKRTKVQAQRKFAQGQSAPSSSYSSTNVTPSCSNGPNTPANRDPPIEILPNKRPKTEDFLTFLCFRGTSDLPPHLDFLNQGDVKGRGKKTPTPTTKKPLKATKNIASMQKKKGRPKGSAKALIAAAAVEAAASSTTSPAKSTKLITKGTMASGDKVAKPNSAMEKLAEQSNKPQDGIASKSPNIPFAVRKRAEQFPDGNRASVGRQLRNAKPSTTTTTTTTTINDPKIESTNKRRSNRTNRKETKTNHDIENDNEDNNDDADEDEEEEDDEYFSAHDEIVKSDGKASTQEIKHVANTAKESVSKDEIKPVHSSPLKDGNDKTKDAKKPAARVTITKQQKNINSKANVDNILPTKSSITNNKTENDKEIIRTKRCLKTDAKFDGAKEKPPPVKRARQKESPIFIPSPEPSGRMTRQRAFFEPVKVPHRSEDETEAEEAKSIRNDALKTELDKSKTKEREIMVPSSPHKAVTNPQIEQKSHVDHPSGKEREASDLKVFDFSSDDEQPLAKSIKLKKTIPTSKLSAAKKTKTAASSSATTGKEAEAPSRLGDKKLQPKNYLVSEKKAPPQVSPTQKKTMTKELKNEKNFKIHITSDEMEEAAAATASLPAKVKKQEETEKLDDKAKTINAATTKRSKSAKESAKSITKAETTELTDDSQKKSINTRQPRKHTKAQDDDTAQIIDGGEDEGEMEAAQTRTQRPTRKTKEAATIYMGIIGHKLQLADDEDDDLSLNSFPDLPNVKEVEKMEIELKKNASQASCGAMKSSQALTAAATEKETTPSVSKPAPLRRGRPPKQTTKSSSSGTLLSKGNKRLAAREKGINTPKADDSLKLAKDKDGAAASSEKFDSDDEDFLLSKEVNVTKRNLAKSFSDSDDEPLAIKVQIKVAGGCEKDPEREASQPSTSAAQTLLTTSTSTPVTESAPPVLQTTSFSTQKHVPTPPPTQNANTLITPIPGVGVVNISPNADISSSVQQPQAVNQQQQQQQQHSVANPFKSSEKKSPVPTSKILNVPATYGTPPPTAPVNVPGVMNAANYGKTYLPPANYHPPPPPVNVRPVPAVHAPHNQMAVPVRVPPTVSVGGAPPPPPPPPPPASHGPIVPIPTQQTSIKYQTSPTTYPPPIEAYPSPKINPNFLTPKFDRMSMPRSSNNNNNNNFPSPSPMPVKFDVAPTTAAPAVPAAATTTTNSKATAGQKTPSSITPTQAAALPGAAAVASTSAGAGAGVNSAVNIAELLKDNLMPSKEESGKIFGIASVSLAQSSGPDNTKCTLGKCGSIHKPVLGPVVPTEGYIGDQMSSKERRKAKVNMTHEQIQKWLIECSSNPDEIQDDLDDDFDDNLRPNMFATTPPPTRDDKESTSFSSSSKATRELGKSESAWSTKGPSLKATPVVAAAVSRKESNTEAEVVIMSEEKTNSEQVAAINTPPKPINSTTILNSSSVEAKLMPKETTETDAGKDVTIIKETAAVEKPESMNKPEIEKEPPSKSKTTTAALDTNQNPASPSIGKQTTNRKKNVASPATAVLAVESKEAAASAPVSTVNLNKAATTSSTTSQAVAGASKTLKRTPVYNQKTQKQVELKETTTTSHRKSAPFSYGAFSADNEKSVYSFDKDDEDEDDADAENTTKSKPVFRRHSQQQQLNEDTTITTPPTKKRAAAAAAEKANKDLANASHNSSVSLTLSPAECSKHVKVSLDADKKAATTTNQSLNTTNASAKIAKSNAKKQADAAASTDKHERAGKQNPSGAGASRDKKDADSDSEGHTFYIPLQSSGAGKDNNGSIQGVAVKLGREGPDGPNQKVIMHATLVTKAQIGSETNASADVKTMENVLTTSEKSATSNKRGTKTTTNASPASTSAAAAATTGKGSGMQSRLKGTSAGATSKEESGGSLVRANSNSSLLSGSAKSRAGAGTNAVNAAPLSCQAVAGKKIKDDTPIKMANNTAFPRHDDPTQMVEAPIFRPTEKEFADPIEFIERITPIAARFGICKIIPPAMFKPECRISDDMRFTAYNQYVHKMLHRWGPSAKELSAIKKYLATQSIVMNHPPWIGGMEVDLPRLYHTVQELGGLKEVIEKKKWARVAEEMCIPKLAQDRVTKLDDIYCKYLLPYDTLSPAERQKLFDEVEADWAKREARARRNADRFVNTESVSNEEDDDTTENDDEESEEEVDGVSMECIVKGRSMALNQFYRIARNTMALWFKNTEPTVNEVEAEFWRHVAVRDSHVCVHSGSIDSSGWGYGFPSPGPKGKGSNYARHPWNLKVLTNNPGSVLRSLGPVMGVTVPTLHVGMLFSACCWYRDPHGLSWIEYLHTGASKLWYGIPDDQSANFRAALTSLIPTHCQNKTIWLPCDTVMVPPHMLTDRGVSLCRIEQRPGEFIVIFPRAYTSSVSTGYVVSESVYFATNSWLDLAKDDFRDIHESCEPAMFSLEQLLFALGHDQRVVSDTLEQMLPMLHEVCEKESAAREQLRAAGVTSTEMVHNEKGAKGKKLLPPFRSVESECDLCRANLYISMVRTDEGNVYCLQHALKNLNNGNIQAKQCKLYHAYNVDDIEKLIKALNERIQLKRSSANKKSK